MAAVGAIALVTGALAVVGGGPRATATYYPAPKNFGAVVLQRIDVNALQQDAADESVVYPYSVIPGGVRNVADFASARSRDGVVAAHYSDVQTADLRVERVTEPAFAYMSYRIGDRVYWTKKKLALKVGETILTDGENSVRGRCGNRISDEAMLPVSDQEPSAAAFEQTTQSPETMLAANSPAVDAAHGEVEPGLTGSALGDQIGSTGTPQLMARNDLPAFGGGNGFGGGTGGGIPSGGSGSGGVGGGGNAARGGSSSGDIISSIPNGNGGIGGGGAAGSDPAGSGSGGGSGSPGNSDGSGSNGGGSNGGGSNGGGSNGGGSNGGGSNGGGSNGGGSNGGGSNGGGSNGGGSNGGGPAVVDADRHVPNEDPNNPNNPGGGDQKDGEQNASVPEPTSLMLFGAGAAGFIARRLRARRRNA